MNMLATALPLALAYLRERALAAALNVLLMGLGVGVIVVLLLVLAQAEDRVERDAAGVDLVVGAKGSPLQLVLSAVYQLDAPTGNIAAADAARVAADPLVKHAVPLALGDSYRGFRIVGTTADYLSLRGATVAHGRAWQQPMEAVLGAAVAARTGLAPGQRFAGTHGLAGGGEHADQLFEVVGILAPTGTVTDRVVLTGVESVWTVHGEHATEGREITALLVQYASPMGAALVPRRINAIDGLQAASPAVEIARLYSLTGVGITALKLFAMITMVCAGLGIFVGLTAVLDERRADLGLLRLLGASRGTVFLTVALQGFALGAMGVILGLVLGHAGTEWIGATAARLHRVELTGLTWVRGEIWLILAALALAALAGFVPAWRAYRNAVPDLLGRS